VGPGVDVAPGVREGVGVGSVSVTVAVVCEPSEPFRGLLKVTVNDLLGAITGLLSSGIAIIFGALSPSFQLAQSRRPWQN